MTMWDQALSRHVYGKLFLIDELIIEGQKCGSSFEKIPFPVLFRPNLLLTLFPPVENGSNDFFASKTAVA